LLQSGELSEARCARVLLERPLQKPAFGERSIRALLEEEMMNRTWLEGVGVGVLLAAMGLRVTPSPQTKVAPPRVAAASEQYADFPPILLPESAAPTLPTERTLPGQGAALVFAFVVDTLGRVESESVETLAAPDSATARAARSNLSGVHYVPARLVLDVGRCVSFNGERGHCGGVTPAVRKIRARTVLRISASTPVPSR
jgi:hypothetical protein